MFQLARRIALALLLCLISCTALLQPAQADEAEVERLQRRIEELEGKLEKVLDSQTKLLEKLHDTSTEKVLQLPAAEILPKPAEAAPDRPPMPLPPPDLPNVAAPAPGGGWHAVGSDMRMFSLWNNGVQTATPQVDFVQHFRGRILYDTGFFNHAPWNQTIPPFDDAQALRSARLGVEGVVWDLVRYRAEFDFANGDGLQINTLLSNVGVNAKDVFVEMTRLPIVGNFRAGYFKEPFSLEQQTQQIHTTFMERSLMDRGQPVVGAADGIQNTNTDLVPGRSTGIMFRNDAFDGRLWAASGWFRVDSDNTGFDNGDGDYAYTTRITGLPYWQQDGRYLVHVGGAYSFREYAQPAPGGGNLPAFNSRAATLGTPLLLNTGILENVNRGDYYGAEVAAVFGPLSIQAEYAGCRLNQISDLPYINYWGAYVYVSYFLTGEHRRYNKNIAAFDRIIPFENFFCIRDGKRALGFLSGKGAWEVALRYSLLDLRSTIFRPVDGLLPNTPNPGSLAGGTGLLHEVTLGLNWYWNPNARMMFNYALTDRDSDSVGFGQVGSMLWRMQFDW